MEHRPCVRFYGGAEPGRQPHPGDVHLHPPVSVALAQASDTIPHGEVWSFEPKFDGWRCLLFCTGEEDGGGVMLQARSGRLITAHFPDLAAAGRDQLPPGLVLDGEVVVWHGDRVDFAAVQRRTLASARRAPTLARMMPASYAAFDVLERAGRDMRSRPFRERRAALLEVLAGVGPPIQAVPATTDREVALRWWRELRGAGIEGVVAKHVEGVYRGAPARGWRKIKHGEARR